MPIRRESPFRGRRLRFDEALVERALMLPRSQPLALIDDSDGLLATGSNYGRPTHPSWSSICSPTPDARSSSEPLQRNTSPSYSPARNVRRRGREPSIPMPVTSVTG